MKYKTGDKFVVEIDSVMTNKKGTLYGIKGFKSLVFDEYGLDILERVDAEDEFRVGDEVIHTNGIKAVITSEVNDGCYCCVMDAEGNTYGWNIDNVEKTGRHFDEVEKLLKRMRE